MAIYTIFTKDLESITKKINRIAKKCKRANVPFTFNVGEAYDKVIGVKSVNGDIVHYIINLTDLEVDCQFKHDGWTALGLVQRKDGIIQCYSTDPSLIKEYSKTDFHCDHCNRHVYRNSVVILEHDSGIRKVVGTSCVEEFTCGLSGNLVASFADLSFELDKNCGRIAKMLDNANSSCEDDVCDADEEFEKIGIYGNLVYDVEKVVACSSNIINAVGFKPSSDDEATWKYIPECYDNYIKYVTESDKSEAMKAIGWILNMSEDEYTQSSYFFNLYQICKSGYCTMRHFGLLASLIPAYKKSELKRIQDALKSKTTSNHVGNIGDKFSLTLIYIKCIHYDSQWGGGYFHFFSDEQGNIFKWSTQTSLKGDGYSPLGIGATVKISGRVKSHDNYKGEKQTVITRCKYDVISSESRAEAHRL